MTIDNEKRKKAIEGLGFDNFMKFVVMIEGAYEGGRYIVEDAIDLVTINYIKMKEIMDGSHS